MEITKTELHERWSSLTYPCLIKLRELILSWEPFDDFDAELADKIFLKKPDADSDDVGSGFYIGTRPDKAKLNALLREFSQPEDSCFAEFMHHFSGLGESADGDGWNFVNENDRWLTLKDGYGEDFEGPERIWDLDSENKRDYDVWKDAFYFYMAGNNDVLFLHSDGRVAWWVMGEAVAHSVSKSFEEFVEKYVELRTQGIAPDSCAGPWESGPF